MKTLKKCAHENFSVFQTSSNLLPQPYSLLDKKKTEFVNSLDEVQNSRAKYEVNIMDLKRKIGQLTSEVEQLQTHLFS